MSEKVIRSGDKANSEADIEVVVGANLTTATDRVVSEEVLPNIGEVDLAEATTASMEEIRGIRPERNSNTETGKQIASTIRRTGSVEMLSQ